MGCLRTPYHLKLFSVEWDEIIIVFCDVETTEEKLVVVYFKELHSKEIKKLRKITIYVRISSATLELRNQDLPSGNESAASLI